ncbi:MAG: DUF488 domain-containing protein [Candidatus Micrarchaeota archaeon]|nr:DUF488 domain-containing protein [Candidatus Micrarchaeota archaeon]
MPVIIEPFSNQNKVFLSVRKKKKSGADLINIKRIFDKASITDGKRVLVDGLWPRGIRKSTANIDLWLKEVAPSKELRLWFSHDPKKWEQFRKRYAKELEENKAFESLLNMAKIGDITLLYATTDDEHNNAVVLLEMLNSKLKK